MSFPLQQMLYVGIGGFVGANARYILTVWVAVRLDAALGMKFPYGTLFVNVTGSLLLAVFSMWFINRIDPPENLRLLTSTGFFGAYTTFSTYANESVALIRIGDWQAGFANIILNNLLCLAGVVLGLWIANRT